MKSISVHAGELTDRYDRPECDLLAEKAKKQAWYVVHTRARHERKVRRKIDDRSMEVFLPEYRAWSSRKDRRKRIMKALFPGYLFVHVSLNPENRLSIIKTPSVVRIVGVGCKPVPLLEHQVESVRIMLNTETEVEPCSMIKPGRLVQVMEGPLSGVVGVVDQAQKKRIVVNIELVGRSVAVSLDQAVLAPYFES